MIRKLKFEYKITIGYLLIGGTWIIFSDKLLNYLIQNKDVLTQLQTYKGWFYVIITAFLFFLFLKKHLARLRTAQKNAEESDVLKTAFLHNISHEIRTPMNSIVGFSDLLNDPNLTFEKRQNYIEIIEKSSEYLLSIITDMVNISTLEAGQEVVYEKDFYLNELLEKLIEQFDPKAKEKNLTLNLSCSLGEQDAYIRTDQIKLISILTNLIGNAIKFTKQGHINFGYTHKGSTLEFYVEDSGIGISPEMHDEIFQRFRQVECSNERQFGGSGLGLSISKAYVELLGGRIWLKSELNKGSIFYFTIDYKKAYHHDIPKSSTDPEEQIRFDSPKVILIAEDDDFTFLLLEEYLSASNLSLVRVTNGYEAIELCKKQHIDLVLMDIKMPLLDGYNASSQIRSIKPNLPIIAQTAYSSDIDIAKAYSSGCSDFINKPIDQKLLRAKINKLLLRS